MGDDKGLQAEEWERPPGKQESENCLLPKPEERRTCLTNPLRKSTAWYWEGWLQNEQLPGEAEKVFFSMNKNRLVKE